jgi:hypothetical protein
MKIKRIIKEWESKQIITGQVMFFFPVDRLVFQGIKR